MIAVRLMGGLGNQMFQYAVARQLAEAHHTSVVMDLAFFENPADVDTPRHYELDCFSLEAHFLAPSRRPGEPDTSYAGTKGKLLLAKHKLTGKAWRVYREPHHNFDPHVLQLPDNSYLVGYWQTEKYFKPIREALLTDFGFKTPASGPNKTLLKEIQSTNAISLHVRRGDYVSNANASRFHGTKDENYYKKALAAIVPKCKNPIVYVFSDEPEWCKKNLRLGIKTVYVEGNTKGFEDMRLMSNCKHNIIANSSFSWWAAWLNQDSDKIVVAPKVWFNDPSVDTSDVIPKSWKRI